MKIYHISCWNINNHVSFNVIEFCIIYIVIRNMIINEFKNPSSGGQQGTVALEDAYNEESYDYGQYGEGGYDDGSGMIDPNTGMPLVGADGNKGKNLHFLSFQRSLCTSLL